MVVGTRPAARTARNRHVGDSPPSARAQHQRGHQQHQRLPGPVADQTRQPRRAPHWPASCSQRSSGGPPALGAGRGHRRGGRSDGTWEHVGPWRRRLDRHRSLQADRWQHRVLVVRVRRSRRGLQVGLNRLDVGAAHQFGQRLGGHQARRDRPDLLSLHARRHDPAVLRVAVRRRRIRRPDPGNGGVLVPVRRMQPRLGVGDLLGQRLGGAEQVQAEREVVELDRVEDRRQVLRAQFGRLLIPEPAAGLNRAADELHRVREVGDRRDGDDGTVRRVVNLVDVRRGRRKDVQGGLQPIQRIPVAAACSSRWPGC